MTDNALLFVDLSSNNSPPNLAKHYRAGHRVLALKATEGTTYTWGDHKRLADEWHRLGGRVWHYHFARPGSPVTQAERFLAAVASCVQPSDVLCLDAEVPGVNGAFARSFLNFCHGKRPNSQLAIYGSAYFLRDNKIRPVHGALLWLAGYPSYPFIPPGWKRVDAHQFADNATVEGCPGKVDCSRLLAYDKPPKKKRHGEHAAASAWRRLVHKIKRGGW